MRAPLPHIVAVGVFRMVERYDVSLDGTTVGSCRIEREGLYYRIVCRCNLVLTEKYYIWFSGNGFEYNLGLCIPTESGCGLTVRVPAKTIDISSGNFLIKRYRREQRCMLRDLPAEIATMLPFLPKLRIRHVDGCTVVYITQN